MCPPVHRTRTAAHPAQSDVAAISPQQLNIAVNSWLDSVQQSLTGLGSNPLTDFLQGALLVVRRNLFNQTPTAKSYEYAVRATGQLVGGITVVDPEGATPTYQVTTAPQNGTAQIDSGGNWTYTPGPDFVFDSFTVLVNDGGFNIFDPTAGQRSVTVRVGNDPNGPVQSALGPGSKYIYNETGIALVSGYYGPRIQGAYNGILAGPPDNFVLQPGDVAEYEVEWNIFSGDPYDVVMEWLAADPPRRVWTVETQYSGTGPLSSLTCSLSSQPCREGLDAPYAYLLPPVTV